MTDAALTAQIRVVARPDGRVTLTAPYSPDLPGRARALGGRWDDATKSWTFDGRDEQRVRDLAHDVYGTDGTDTATATVRVDVARLAADVDLGKGPLMLAGHKVAERRGRDLPVQLGPGVVVVAGTFSVSGGSVANPRIDDVDGVVVEVRDLPAGAARRAVAEHPQAVTLVDGQNVDRETLAAERERLLARLAEIDALIGSDR